MSYMPELAVRRKVKYLKLHVGRFVLSKWREISEESGLFKEKGVIDHK